MKNKKKIIGIIIIVLVVLVGVAVGLMLWLNSKDDNKPMNPTATNSYEVNTNIIEFSIDEDKILVGETKKVTFLAKVKTEEYKGVSIILLKNRRDDKILNNLYDDGTHGDEIAGDGIYTNQIDMKSDIRELEYYYAEINDKKSIAREITFSKPFTEEEWAERDAIAEEVVAIISTYKYTGNDKVDANNAAQIVEKIIEYLDNKKELGIVRRYSIDQASASVTLSSGFPMLFPFSFVPGYQSSPSLSTISNISRQQSVENENGNQKIITLEPYKGEFKSTAYDDSANQIVKSNSNYEFNNNIDNQEVTIEILKNLENYRIIILNAHGWWSDEYHAYFQISQELTDELKQEHADYNRYINDLSIFPFDNADGKGIVVTYKFFKDVYKNKKLNHSLIYLGSCRSMEGSYLHNALKDCGAETILGYKGTVWSTYNEKMCGTIFDELSKGKSISEAIEMARSNNGSVDNTYNSIFFKLFNDNVKKHLKQKEENNLPKAELEYSGNMNFRLSDNLETPLPTKEIETSDTTSNQSETTNETNNILTIEKAKELIHKYFENTLDPNDDIISINAMEKRKISDSIVKFDLRADTKSAEWTGNANVLVGIIQVDLTTGQGIISEGEFTGTINLLDIPEKQNIHSNHSENGTIIYKNEMLGFELTLPKSWKGLYKVEEYEGGVDFYNIKNLEFGGLLFGIEFSEIKLIENENYPLELIYEEQGLYVYNSGFTDFQYDYENENSTLSKEYKMMRESIPDIVKSFKLNKS